VLSLSTAVLVTQREETLLTLADFAVSLLLVATVFNLGADFTWVRSYPFPFSWSEGNRLWDYSILFGRNLYNYPTDQPIFAFIDRGRQSLWGLPFLIPGVTIKGVRLWGALVVILPYALLGLTAFKRYRYQSKLWLLTGLWSYVYLSGGAIYTPLVLSAILIALAWRRRLWVALPLIALAGYYAQLSRFTWAFAPAIWAGMLYFAGGSGKNQAKPSARWINAAAGVLAGMIGGYIIPKWPKIEDQIASLLRWDTTSSSGATSPVDILGASTVIDAITDQPLLWYRLLPNPTFSLGILLGLLILTAPLIIFLIYLAWTRRWEIGRLRGAALILSLLAFLGVGLVASVKIGGGSNLHNLDMFLIGLLFTAAIAWGAGGNQTLVHLHRQSWWVQGLVVLMMFNMSYVPVVGALPQVIPADQEVQEALSIVHEEVQRASQKGDVLFLDHRQLLTFGYVPRIPLIVEYEKKYVMDNALSGNKSYFRNFYDDLERQRFVLIVSEPLRLTIQDDEYQFGDENNTWVTWVSEPLLCYYKPIVTIKSVKIQLLVPRKATARCADLPILSP